MKLNHDCIRAVLLYLENSLDYEHYLDLTNFSVDGFSIEDTHYSIKKLEEAGFISAIVARDIDGEISVDVFGITWEGHKFLDTIRDNQVWNSTKKILSKFSSSSISFVSNVASQVLTNLINQQMGFPTQSQS